MHKIILDSKEIIPSKIICIGKNYVAHIEELDSEIPSENIFFLKPNSAIADDIYFNANDVVHYESEISFMIMNNELYGVGFGLDLTKRDLQNHLSNKGLPWERCKAFDKSAVFGNFVSFDGDLKSLSLELSINGLKVQAGNYDLMINKPEDVLAEVKSLFTLEDGDILMTGTPKGSTSYNIGDEFVGKIISENCTLIEKSWTVK